MDERVYIYDGELVSKEEYIKKIGLSGYEDVYDRIQASTNENQNIDELYLIQLFDYNCPSCVSGVTKVFVEDIEEFARLYQSIEEDDNRIERLLKSKSGEIITDYYSDDPDLNIVQKFPVDDLGYALDFKTDTTISLINGYGYPNDYYFGLLIYEIRWVKCKGKFYKLVKPYGLDCAKKYELDMLKPWRHVEVYGNPFWLRNGIDKMKKLSERENFKGTRIESYVWQVAEIFDTEEAMKEDKRLLSIRGLSEKQIRRVFADIPGDAG